MQYQVDDAGRQVVIGEGPDLDATVVGVELAAEPPLELPPVDLWAEAPP
jgi:hypothetical protein